MKLPLVFIVMLIALVVWILITDKPVFARSKFVSIAWLVAQCFMLATAWHYISRYVG